jgi:hypothetical protein
MKISKKKQFKKTVLVKNKSHEMELLKKYERQISLYVDSYLVLSEEGDPTQIALARQKAKNEFLKYGPEIHRIAAEIGGDLSIFVADFLESIDTVLHGQGMLDEDLISHCLDSTARLKAELKSHTPQHRI